MPSDLSRPLADVPPGATEPAPDCPLCPRLVAFREEWQAKEPDWHNAPVRSFGPQDAQLLIVGLAPGLRGANQTGRPFTGDYAGDLLYQTLDRFGFSRGTFQARPDDGLELVDVRITNAVRCVPPQNKPTGPEIRTCRPFLLNTLAAMENLRAVMVLGRIAHDTLLSALGERRAAHPFSHGGRHEVTAEGRRLALFDSYHCSRYNTNTGVLTTEMFEDVFAAISEFLDRPARPGD